MYCIDATPDPTSATPADDEDRKKTPQGEEALRPRARQNVIFELGFFFGFLGRGRVCAIYEKGVELSSDLHGVLYVEHDEGGGLDVRSG